MKTLTAGALAALAALALAGPAAAKPATYELEIKGEQLTTWDYQKQMEPTCDFPESDWGRQYIEFRTYKRGDWGKPKVQLKKNKAGGVDVHFLAPEVELMADAEIRRNYRVLYSQISECPPGQGPFGGGDPPKDAVGTVDCKADGSLPFYMGNSIAEVESPYYPTDLAGQKPPKSPLYFAAEQYWIGATGSDYNLPSACTAKGSDGASIGIVESQGEWAGAVIPVVDSVPAKKLLKLKKNKTGKFELGRTVKYPNEVQTYGGPPHTTGKTRIDATITFKRLGR